MPAFIWTKHFLEVHVLLGSISLFLVHSDYHTDNINGNSHLTVSSAVKFHREISWYHLF